MRFSTSALATAAIVATANAANKGFNYGAFFMDQSPKRQADFEYEFKAAKQLPGTGSQFTSARLYTMVQWQTTNTVIEAIQAAINTKTTLLLGLWASSGTTAFNNEIVALKAAIAKYGTSFTDLVVGISVGSEDLYRVSPTGIANKGGPGANPNELIKYIAQTRAAIKGTGLASKPIGHVDTWTAYVNGSNSGVISALDFIGVDAYPYWETTTANSIGNANASFYDAYKKTVTAAKGKPVWVTETGWPVSGPKQNLAVASPANARIFWQDVSCSLMKNNVHLYYYTLQDVQYGTPSPSFGIKPAGDLMAVKPLFDLTCPAKVSYFFPLFVSSILSPLFLLLLYNGSIVSSLISPILSAKCPRCSCDRTGFISPPVHPPVWAKRPSDWCAWANGYAKDPSVISSASLSSSSTEVLMSIPTPSAISEAPMTSAPTIAPAPTTMTSKLSKPTEISLPNIPIGLFGLYEIPHLLVPIDLSNAGNIIGSRYVAQISSTHSTLFNFYIPPEYQGKTCNLVFHVPPESQEWWHPWHLTTPGGIVFSQLDIPATAFTSSGTVSNSSTGPIGGVNSLESGGHLVSSAPCEAGNKLGYRADAVGAMDLQYFQMTSPAAGLFMIISG